LATPRRETQYFRDFGPQFLFTHILVYILVHIVRIAPSPAPLGCEFDRIGLDAEEIHGRARLGRVRLCFDGKSTFLPTTTSGSSGHEIEVYQEVDVARMTLHVFSGGLRTNGVEIVGRRRSSSFEIFATGRLQPATTP
jgi:hypothetical protein